jgi:hypothetical protein
MKNFGFGIADCGFEEGSRFQVSGFVPALPLDVRRRLCPAG